MMRRSPSGTFALRSPNQAQVILYRHLDLTLALALHHLVRNCPLCRCVSITDAGCST